LLNALGKKESGDAGLVESCGRGVISLSKTVSDSQVNVIASRNVQGQWEVRISVHKERGEEESSR